MILEMDCGNSFIKWRVICDASGVAMGGGTVESPARLLEALHSMDALRLTHCRFVSVRGRDETRALAAEIGGAFSIPVEIAAPSFELAGVMNGYEEHQKLGMDRWLALVAAFRLARGACVVFDLGTAVTCDLVTSDGKHLGGYICPGVPLMRDQLRTHTRRIRYDDAAAEKALTFLEPGRSTVEAVERGCTLMMRSFVSSQVELAKEYLGDKVEVYLTGGDALLASEAVPGARIVPDLVFQGLAIACPLPGAA